MSYRVFVLRRAQKELAALPRGVYPRLREHLLSLADDPRPPGAKKLVGRDGWRLRVGDYRAIYEIDDDGHRVTVLHVGPRSNIYR